MGYNKIKVPAAGEKITVNADHSLNVPDNPIIPTAKVEPFDTAEVVYAVSFNNGLGRKVQNLRHGAIFVPYRISNPIGASPTPQDIIARTKIVIPKLNEPRIGIMNWITLPHRGLLPEDIVSCAANHGVIAEITGKDLIPISTYKGVISGSGKESQKIRHTGTVFQ